MNIEKLARHLKEFTLDEIEMIAECDCKNKLEHLLNANKIVFEQGIYKVVYKNTANIFKLILEPEYKLGKTILFKDMACCYLSTRKLTKETLKGYNSRLKYDILPFFGEMNIKEITFDKIFDFMENLKLVYKPKTVKNSVTLLGSILKYAFEQGYIKHNPYYGIRNSMCK